MGKQAARKRKPARRRGAAAGGSRGRRRHGSRGLLVVLLLAAGAALLAFDGHRVASASMADTLLIGDRVLVDVISTHLSPPEPGDVVRLRPPEGGADEGVLERCIAVAGQRVEIVDKAVFVDGERLPDPPFSKYEDAHLLPAASSHRDNLPARTVPAGHIFVLGDNRDRSRDSRHFGAVPLERVVGRARFIYFSAAGQGLRWSRIGSLIR